MKRILFFLIIVLLPVNSWAAYKIYLNNGSVISGVTSYDEAGDEVNLYFGTGSMTVPKGDVLKIEGSESRETVTKERQETPPEQSKGQEQEMPAPAPAAPEYDKSSRVNELNADLDSVNSEIRSAEEEEARLVAAISEKTGARTKDDLMQMKDLEAELEPLRQDLNAVRQKKEGLVQRRKSIQDELAAPAQ